jgi:hypothetical protein
VHRESGGRVLVEAEHFHAQELDAVRRWYRIDSSTPPPSLPGAKEAHAAGASGGAYLKLLPDTRQTPADKLTAGENFSNQPGQLAVLRYEIEFSTPGRYYLWVRAYSTGSEDNGLHAGLDGAWPESGRRLQWCEGKNSWRWDSRQRTEANHCGEPGKIWLDVPAAGRHTVTFSMREDGFEFDAFLLTTDARHTPGQ